MWQKWPLEVTKSQKVECQTARGLPARRRVVAAGLADGKEKGISKRLEMWKKKEKKKKNACFQREY